ncbi:MAG TPA: hypothetical protein DIU15_00600 [Deltaproteobacteria bacterium]|nr:hypothetical protein [Deltaproteobacteria bacterium]HCP44528.1 hypothetical protein [Deltaproteobacteria bacterium]
MSTYAKTIQGHQCDECGAEMVLLLFCDHCGADYPERKRLNAFSLLGLEPAFSLADETIDGLEIELTRRLHPDKWQHRGERLHRKALLAQTAANQALQAIREPFERGDTLLLLQEEVSSGQLDGNNSLPQEFLVEQLELQEEIAEGLEPDRKRALKSLVRAELDSLRSQLSDQFVRVQQVETDSERLDALKSARTCLDRARYWRNLRMALKGVAAR